MPTIRELIRNVDQRPSWLGEISLHREDNYERTSASRLDAWFRSYVTAIIQKDICDLANIAAFTETPKLLWFIVG